MSKPAPPPNPPPPASAGQDRIAALFRALSLDAEWPGLDTIVLQARAAGLSLDEVHSLVRAMAVTIASLPALDRQAMFAQIRGAQRQAALLILDRAPVGPLATREREALLTAAELLLEVEAPDKAAAVFERVGDARRAAQAWGAAGDLVRMEACLARDQDQRSARRDLRDLAARFEGLMLAGQRLAAIDLVAGNESADAQDLKRQAVDVESRLCPGLGVALRTSDGAILHFAGLPAVLGREGRCQVVLRDPGISRRHATLSSEGSRLFIEDAGSRTGTGLCGARLSGRVPLPPAGELSLGQRCHLAFQMHGPDLLELTCHDGLDRGLRVWLGPGPIPLSAALAGGEGLRIVPGERTARIALACPVRLNGKLVGNGFDVLRGDVIESGPLRLEAL
jgi:hypothetical protein